MKKIYIFFILRFIIIFFLSTFRSFLDLYPTFQSKLAPKKYAVLWIFWNLAFGVVALFCGGQEDQLN